MGPRRRPAIIDRMPGHGGARYRSGWSANDQFDQRSFQPWIYRHPVNPPPNSSSPTVLSLRASGPRLDAPPWWTEDPPTASDSDVIERPATPVRAGSRSTSTSRRRTALPARVGSTGPDPG